MTDLTLVRHSTAAAFLARAEDWLCGREPEHNLILGLSNQLRPKFAPSAYLATVEDAGSPVAAAVMVPPYKAVLARSPSREAQRLLTADLAASGFAVPGIFGPVAQVNAFVEEWQRLTECLLRAGERYGIYELRVVAHPTYSPGRLRLADPSDAEVLAPWRAGFTLDTGHDAEPPDVNRRALDALVEQGALYAWEDQGLASMAAVNRRTPHGRSIGLVYTPPDLRGHGYAASCVAALSQLILDGGCDFCCLFTLLRDPIPNAIYQRIGYRLVAEWEDAFFE